MAKFLIVTFNYGGRSDGQSIVGPHVESALDWYRFAPHAWVVWSNRSADEWYKIIQPHVGEKITFFVCELNVGDSQGWMNKEFWEWLNRDRSN